jgi:hypothetical protein
LLSSLVQIIFSISSSTGVHEESNSVFTAKRKKSSRAGFKSCAPGRDQ